MPAFVAMLRGVNVGGHNKLAMAELRRIATACGFEDVRTYIQSGNLVFRAPASNLSEMPELLRGQITTETGLNPDVAIRSRDELSAAIADNPYLPRQLDTTYCHILFLVDSAGNPTLDRLDLARYAPEEAALIGREVHLYTPNGLGRSKLAVDLGRARGLVGTVRNWRTVTTLLTMAEEVG